MCTVGREVQWPTESGRVHSMEEIHRIRLRLSPGSLSGIAWQFEKLSFSLASPVGAWAPAINAYRYPGQIVICVELAGVDQAQIKLQVEARRVTLRGCRSLPKPMVPPESPSQILAMEIDDGLFVREVVLPISVLPEQVRASQVNGFLWIHLPIEPVT